MASEGGMLRPAQLQRGAVQASLTRRYVSGSGHRSTPSIIGTGHPVLCMTQGCCSYYYSSVPLGTIIWIK